MIVLFLKEIIKNSDVVNAYKLYMNDIHCMAANFGIEAAVKILINVKFNIKNNYFILFKNLK